ncbi:hypothetical protein [Halobellus ordinarius]|uniref:capsular polysaccharide export protein, LipB/KpsS family n=1 Tax=Halobellus ordinarius TaxID=3075120 RepID=UPI0028805419|nr:hypothetical protein [Halobellus sp. ZY16]
MDLPLELKRKTLESAHILGLGDGIAQVYDHLSDRIDYEVDPRIAEYSLADDEVEGYVLLPTVEGSNRNAYRTYIIGHAFRTRGYRPIVPLCNADLELCMRKSPDWDSDAVCHLCNHHGRVLADAFGFDQVDLQNLIPGDVAYGVESYLNGDKSTYRGINVAEFATASARKFLQKYHVMSDPEERQIVRRFLVTACHLTDAFYTLFDEYDFETCFTNDPAYVYGGVPLAVADANGVVGYSSSRAYRDRALLFGRTANSTWLPQFEDHEFLTSLLNEPLSDEQRAHVNRIMSGRETGDHTRVHYTTQESESVDDGGSGTFAAMFTNLIWDASLEAGEAAYDDPFEWISDTIEWFNEHKEETLVVKLHPAESKFGTNERVGEWITEHYRPLPGNIEMLPPETDVNTYQLLDEIDVAIVYNSTVGFEMAYNGGPVVVAGDTHYRDHGFTFDADTKRGYFDYLDQLKTLELSEEEHTRAIRYVYRLLVTRHIDWPYSETNEETGEVELLPVSHDDVTPGNELFDHIVKASLAGDPIVSPEASHLLN